MNPEPESLDPETNQRLAGFKAAQPPQAPSQAARRAAYLAALESLPPTVPPSRSRRFAFLWAAWPWKERKMIPIISTLILVFALAFGGGGVALASAQDSLPGEPLYPVKQWSEQVQYNLATSEQNRFDLALQFTQRRFTELNTLSASGQVLPATLGEQVQNQVYQALASASRLDAPAQTQALVRLQQLLEVQFQQMAQGEPAEPVLVQVRSMIQEHIRLATLGQEDPAALQLHIQDRDRIQSHTSQPTGIPQPGAGAGNGQNGSNQGDPGPKGPNNPAVTPAHTPVQDGTGNQYGSPGAGQGSGSGAGTPASTPQGTQSGAGSGFGPGAGPGAGTCTPQCTPVGTQAGQPGGAQNPGGPGPGPMTTPTPGTPPGGGEPPAPSPAPSGVPGAGPGPNPNPGTPPGGGEPPAPTPAPGQPGYGPGPGPAPSVTPGSGGGGGGGGGGNGSGGG